MEVGEIYNPTLDNRFKYFYLSFLWQFKQQLKHISILLVEFKLWVLLFTMNVGGIQAVFA